MSYTPHEWSTGETITAAKLNALENGAAEGGGYDAVIRLTHADNSGDDNAGNLTPSIESGTYAQLYAITDDGGVPNIRVEYYHPWGYYGTLDAMITYVELDAIVMNVSGFWPFMNGGNLGSIGGLVWSSEDSIFWD